MEQGLVGNNNNGKKQLMTEGLNKINVCTYTTLADLLIKYVPAYSYVCDLSQTIGGYLFMNEFASRLVDEIESNPSSSFVVNSFKYINEIGQATNLEVLNILKVGILEILFSSNIDKAIIIRYLSENVRKQFLEFSKFYY